MKEWNDDENLSQKLETSIEFKDPILISESSSGPGLVSNPDIINNIWITKSIKTAKYDILSSTTSDFIFWQTVSDFECFTWGGQVDKKIDKYWWALMCSKMLFYDMDFSSQ